MNIDKITEDFHKAIADIVSHPSVQAMKNIPQHTDAVSCYEHCIYVSYLSFLLCSKLGFDAVAAARGALLHDFHLKDPANHNMKCLGWLINHPLIALDNANEHFNLTELEQDIISKHMWPLAPIKIPKYKESFVVNIIDTTCAALEYLGIHKKSWKMVVTSFC